jgi:drug/metabolite transporter (DMT)-like permease
VPTPTLGSVTVLAVTFALLSATAAAVSTSVQHQAAETAPPSVVGAWHLLGHLVRRPIWLAGQVLGSLALVFHALALHSGPIALVQPLVISGIVLAVPVRAAIARTLPPRRDVIAVLIAAVGLAVFLVVSDPSAGRGTGLGALALTLVLGCLVVSTIGIAIAQRLADPTLRAFILGACAGIFFALVAVLLKMSLELSSQDGLARLLASWPVYLLVLAGVGGILCNQLAYRSARLASSMPVLNVVDCLVALAFGYVVFHEVPRHTPGVVVLEALSLMAMLLWILARDTVEPPEAPVEPDPGARGEVVAGER